MYGKKEALTITEKYLAILKKFEASGGQSKITQLFEGPTSLEEGQLLNNTFKNSEVKNLPDFHGLNYLKEPKKAEESFLEAKEQRKVRFIEGAEIIDNNSVFNLSIDLDASPFPE